MKRKKLQIVPDGGQPLVSGLSRDEEVRALKLADIALQTPAAPQPIQAAGTRARTEHQELMKELQREASKVRNLEHAA